MPSSPPADRATSGEAATHTATKTHSIVGRITATSAGVAVLFILLRLLAISEWNWHTAAAVADTLDFGGTLSMLYGTLLAEHLFTSLLAMWLLPVSLLGLIWRYQQGNHPGLGDILFISVLVATFVALVTTFAEWWLPVGALALGGILWGIRLIWHRGVGRRLVMFLTRQAGATALIGVLILAAILQTPWMSREIIGTQQGDLGAYVLETQPGYLVVLTASSREFRILTTAEVHSRRIDD